MEKGFESGFIVLLKLENYLFSENSLSYIPVLLVSLGSSLLNWMNVAGGGGWVTTV